MEDYNSQQYLIDKNGEINNHNDFINEDDKNEMDQIYDDKSELVQLEQEFQDNEETLLKLEKINVQMEIEQSVRKKIQKPNKPQTPYVAFMKNFVRTQGLTFKDMSRIWNEMTVDQKQIYINIAQEDKLRFNTEMEAYVSQMDLEDNDNSNEILNQIENDFSFPLSRIKNIINSDENNKRTKKSTILFVEKATELFGELIIKLSVDEMLQKKRKKLQKSDLDNVIKKNPLLSFLSSTGILQEQQQLENNDKTDYEQKPQVVKQKVIVKDKGPKNNSKIDQFFKKI